MPSLVFARSVVLVKVKRRIVRTDRTLLYILDCLVKKRNQIFSIVAKVYKKLLSKKITKSIQDQKEEVFTSCYYYNLSKIAL